MGYRLTHIFHESSHNPTPRLGIAFTPGFWTGKHQTLSAAWRAKVCLYWNRWPNSVLIQQCLENTERQTKGAFLCHTVTVSREAAWAFLGSQKPYKHTASWPSVATVHILRTCHAVEMQPQEYGVAQSSDGLQEGTTFVFLILGKHTDRNAHVHTSIGTWRHKDRKRGLCISIDHRGSPSMVCLFSLIQPH